MYRHLEWLEGLAHERSFPIHRVSAGNLREAVLQSKNGKRFASIPLHTLNPQGGQGILKRQCTAEHKIQPITQKLRELVGSGKGRPVRPDADGNPIRVEQWFGISWDEMHRMKEPRDKWIRNVYPLLGAGLWDEPNCVTIGRRMTRADCLFWLHQHDYPEPPKSACIGCPYHARHNWREMRNNAPEEWADAVAFDKEIRTGLKGVEMPVFLHRDCVPLDEANLSTPEDRGLGNLFDPMGLVNECDGMCGV